MDKTTKKNISNVETLINLKVAKCCGTCTHSNYSTRTLNSHCLKHPKIDDILDNYHETNICDDYSDNRMS